MQVFANLTTERLEHFRETCLWLLGEADLELEKRKSSAAEVLMENSPAAAAPPIKRFRKKKTIRREPNELIERLAGYREENRFSQGELARRLGTTVTSVSNWLHGKWQPSARATLKIKKLLDR